MTLIPGFAKIHTSVWKLLGQTWSHKPTCLCNRVRKFRFCCVKGISLWPLRCDLEFCGERRTWFCGVNCVGICFLSFSVPHLPWAIPQAVFWRVRCISGERSVLYPACIPQLLKLPCHLTIVATSRLSRREMFWPRFGKLLVPPSVHDKLTLPDKGSELQSDVRHAFAVMLVDYSPIFWFVCSTYSCTQDIRTFTTCEVHGS